MLSSVFCIEKTVISKAFGMVVTRAMARRSYSFSEDLFSTPQRSLPTPSPKKSCPPAPVSRSPLRRLPTPAPHLSVTRYVCRFCKNYNDTLGSARIINDSNSSTLPSSNILFSKLDMFDLKMSDIGKRISDIESSISDLLSAVNILERDIANFANISFSSKVKSNLDPKSSSSQTLHSLSSHTQTSPTNTPHVRFTASANSSSTLNRLNVNTIPSTASSPTSTLQQGHTPPATPSSTLSHHRARTAPFNSSSSISTHPKKSLLILGDSNTRHVKFHNISFARIPTFTIQAVDPYKCKGFAKIWIHVGINSLKRCHTPYDVERCFQMFMKKIEQIQKVSPSSKLIVSPILPTGIPLLNAKAVLFNARLFSVPRLWSILNFSVFAVKNNTLSREFRSFRNRQDLIHLGYRGISTLTDMVARQLYSVDARSYARVIKSNT